MKMYQKLKKSLLLPIALLLLALNASAQLTVTLTPNNVNCEGLRTGQITANVTGGVPPYQYKWSNGEYTQSISSLHGGYYHCYVVDANGSSVEKEITLTEPEELRIVQFDATIYSNNYNTSCYNCNDGAITVAVAGGTPPYTYTWSDGSNLQNRTNLVAKDYQLVVTDAFGCQVRELNKELSKPEHIDWAPEGNVNNNQNAFFGTKATSTYPDVIFRSLDVEGFRLKSNLDAIFSGKIGVGTTTPTEKFEVVGGNAKFGANTTTIGQSTVGSLKVPSFANSTSTTNLGGFDNNGQLVLLPYKDISAAFYKLATCSSEDILTGQTTESPSWGVKAIGTTNYLNVLGTCNRVYIGENIANLPSTITNLPTFRVTGSSQFTSAVGIGTAPSATNTLHIKSDNANILLEDNISINLYDELANLKLEASGGYGRLVSNKGIALFINSDATTNDLNESCFRILKEGDQIPNSTNGSTAAKDIFKIKANGEVYAQKVIVQLPNGNSFPDYVFEPTYRLTPLFEVEKFIKANKHLPEVPSAKELEKTGIDTQEMLSTQMKKIEELTLYLIQQQKEIDELKAKLK